jgi:C4-dicarboxylate-specific signal transduction histidine kinase
MEMAEQFNKQQLLLAKAEASNIQAYIGKVKDEMLRISQFISISQADQDKIFSFLSSEVFRDLGRFDMGIKFLDSEGKVLLKSGDLAIERPSNRDLVEIARKFCPSDVQINQDKSNVFILAPVCRAGTLIGALVTSINIQDLAGEFLGPIKSGARGYAWMMDGKGDLLYHPTQPEMVGRNLYKTDSSCFKCHKSFDVEKKIIEGKGDYYGKYVAPSGEDKVLAFSTASVGDSKWIVAVSAPYSEVTMPIHRSMRFHSWIIILVFVTTSVVSAMLMVLNRKRVKAEELAKHQKYIEKYAQELEQEVDIRTKELTTEKEKLNTVISTIGSGIILIDNNRDILWINRKMKDIAGKDITGMKCDEFFSDCTIIGSYKINDMQTDVLTDLFGQSDKHFQVTTAPVKGVGEGVQGYIRLVDDITDMKNMQEQMMHSEKLSLLGRLTAGIVNEIGNPLTSVFSFVRMLKEKEKDEFKKESLETIDLYMNRIAEIFKLLSSFSKMPRLELKTWKVSSLIEYSLSLIQYDAGVDNITIVRDIQPDVPELITDGNQLSQVMVNIVFNAADAMPDGGKLTIQSRAKDKNIVISFEDTGAGIPEDDLIRIFDPFYTTKDKGSGLGLAVSQNIIQKLNGSLTVSSEINKGSRFVIILPID